MNSSEKRLLSGFESKDSDKISHLPGYTDEINFAQYSGYLNGSEDGDVQLHYWFAESQKDPSKDPLVLWLNGGPGCSFLEALFSGNGPFRVDGSGDCLSRNEYSWNRVANMIYLGYA